MSSTAPQPDRHATFPPPLAATLPPIGAPVDHDRLPLERGQTVRAFQLSNGLERSYAARVVAREGDLVWTLLRPERGAPDPAPGDEVVVQAWRDMDARYTLRARVMATERAPVGCFGLSVVAMARVQDREYVRVIIPGAAEEAESFDALGHSRPCWLAVRDLSAAGIRARCSLTPEIEDEIESILRLPDGGPPAPFRVRVVRVVDALDPKQATCTLGAAFIDLQPVLRERIIRQVLRVQRELRRREAAI